MNHQNYQNNNNHASGIVKERKDIAIGKQQLNKQQVAIKARCTHILDSGYPSVKRVTARMPLREVDGNRATLLTQIQKKYPDITNIDDPAIQNEIVEITRFQCVICEKVLDIVPVDGNRRADALRILDTMLDQIKMGLGFKDPEILGKLSRTQYILSTLIPNAYETTLNRSMINTNRQSQKSSGSVTWGNRR